MSNQDFTLKIEDSALFELFSAARWGWTHDIKIAYAGYKSQFKSPNARKISRDRIKRTLKKAISCYKASPCHYGNGWKSEVRQIVKGAISLAEVK